MGITIGPNITIGPRILIDEVPIGQAEYTTAGSYTWTAPTGVKSVCVVCVGGGGGGQGNQGGGAGAGGGT